MANFFIFNEHDYIKVFNSLIEQLTGKSWFCGTIVTFIEDIECRLSCATALSQIRCKESDSPPSRLSITPIWYEMTTRIGRHELSNDFDFYTMIKTAA